MKIKGKATLRKPKSRSYFFAAFALTGMLMTNTASSFPVEDIPHTIQAYITHVMRLQQMITQYQSQIAHYAQQITHMRQQLISVGGLRDISMPMTDNFERRADDYGMAAACPGAGSMSLASLMSAFSLDMNGDIKEQQKEICQRIVLAKNAQYNEAVKMLATVRQQDSQLQAIAAERAAAGTDQGKLAANDNKLNQFLARATTSTQYSNTVIAAYETYIKSLEDNQQLLTQQALTGNTGNQTFASTLANKFVQGVALEAALRAVETRDR